MKLTELLREEGYRTQNYSTREQNSDFQAVHDYDVVDLFDELSEQLERIPTQREFVNAGTERARVFFSKPVYIFKQRKNKQFTWDDNLIACVQSRLANTYRSYIIEVQVEQFIKANYKVKTISNRHLDLTFGADIVVWDTETDGLWYLHIAANSKWSKQMVEDKGRRKPYIPKDGQKHYWKREWNKYNEPHQLVLFNTTLSDRMQEVNGNLLFDEPYLKFYFDKLFASDSYDRKGNSEFEEFYRFLNKNEIV